MAAEALEPIPLEPEYALETQFRRICDMWEKSRVQIIDGRIVVNPVPTGEHNRIVYLLLLQLLAVVQERGWQIWPDITVRLLSQSTDEGYEQEVDVAFGRPIDLPEPWGLTLDTATLTT